LTELLKNKKVGVLGTQCITRPFVEVSFGANAGFRQNQVKLHCVPKMSLLCLALTLTCMNQFC